MSPTQKESITPLTQRSQVFLYTALNSTKMAKKHEKEKKFFASLPSPKNQPQIQKLQLLRLIFNFPQKVHFPCCLHIPAFIALFFVSFGVEPKNDFAVYVQIFCLSLPCEALVLDFSSYLEFS